MSENQNEEEEEEVFEVFPKIDIATLDFADKVKEQVVSMHSGNREIEIWTEAGFGTAHQQLIFTVWYKTREDREAAIIDGEVKSIEESIREC